MLKHTIFVALELNFMHIEDSQADAQLHELLKTSQVLQCHNSTRMLSQKKNGFRCSGSSKKRKMGRMACIFAFKANEAQWLGVCSLFQK